MVWRIVRQPNGKYARYSDVAGSFTHHNMTAEQAVEYCRENMMSRADALATVARADQPATWEECLRSIRAAHGKIRMAALLKEMREKPPEWLNDDEGDRRG
jgi:hypothetical protein